jgi:nucleoside-diphosphate-sugar epimerase
MMNQPVAITGATGFIGRHVARSLTLRGVPWKGLVRSPDKLRRLGLEACEVIQGHLEDGEALQRLCRGAGAVIHCGGSIAGLNRNDFFQVNVRGTGALLRACREARVRRFVHVSSLAAREPHLSSYAASKRESEAILAKEAKDLSWVVVRPPAVYGPGDEATIPLIRALTWRVALVPGHGASRLSLIHVADLASALVHLAQRQDPTERIIELDDGKAGGYSFEEIAAAATAVTGVSTRVIFVPRSMLILPAWFSLIRGWVKGAPAVFSPGKLGELYHRDWVVNPESSHLPGWQPRIDFSTGFKETLQWYLEHGWLPEGHRQSESDGRT